GVRVSHFLAALIVVLAPSSARAAEPGGSVQLAPEFGARVGIGLPLGDVSGNNGNTGADTSMSTPFGTLVPLIGELGVRVERSFFIGLYVGYGFLSVNTGRQGQGCVQGASCDAHDVRLGIEGLYHLSPDGPIDPWLGIGFGYEWLSLHGEQSSGTLTGSS